jgi:hypothetical protein
MARHRRSHGPTRAMRAAVTLLAAVSLCLAAWGVPVAGAEVSFAPPTTYYAGQYPADVAMDDFNGDGDLDLAVANSTDAGKVSVLVGGPGGSFGSPTTYQAGKLSRSVATGDFNDDGDPDLVVGNYQNTGLEGATVSVRLGGAGASFGSPNTYFVGFDVMGVVVGDFNDDGDPDLAVINSFINDSSVSILLGEAGGSFGAQTKYPVGRMPWSIAIGDFNGDADPDLATANAEASKVSVLVGGAGGTFSAATNYGAGEGAGAVGVGDFNGDGDLDLVSGGENVWVRLGGAGASFGGPTQYAGGGFTTGKVAVRDLNLDGDPDVALRTNTPSNTLAVAVLTGGAGGSFLPYKLFSDGSAGRSVVAGDVDRDGDPDLVTTNDYAQLAPVSVLLNQALRLTPASVAFQPRPDHTGSKPKTVTLSNMSDGPLTVSDISFIGPDATSFLASGDTCSGVAVAGGQSCTVQVRFRPLGAGAKTALLRLGNDGPGQDSLVSLSGTSTPAPWLTTSVQALKFGKHAVGTTAAAQSVTITNVGSAPMSISDIGIAGANAGDFILVGESCTTQTSIAPGGSCAASASFRPTATGPRSASLTITDTAPGSPHRVALAGTGN